jgi:hypothetical protein
VDAVVGAAVEDNHHMGIYALKLQFLVEVAKVG